MELSFHLWEIVHAQQCNISCKSVGCSSKGWGMILVPVFLEGIAFQQILILWLIYHFTRGAQRVGNIFITREKTLIDGRWVLNPCSKCCHVVIINKLSNAIQISLLMITYLALVIMTPLIGMLLPIWKIQLTMAVISIPSIPSFT